MSLVVKAPAASALALTAARPAAPPRTSRLPAPILKLDGHQGEVHSLRFDRSGRFLASASSDRSVLVWSVFGGGEGTGDQPANTLQLVGHKNAVLDTLWPRGPASSPAASSAPTELVSASADATCALWDLTSGQRVRRFVGHEAAASRLVAPSRGADVFMSGSDDGYVLAWDPRSKNYVDELDTGLPVIGLACSDTADVVFTGSVDNAVHAWDVRARTVAFSLRGHRDTITGMALSPDGTQLATCAADSTVRVWDVKPFSAVPSRCTAVLEGAPHDGAARAAQTQPAWSPDGAHLACGALGDASVVVWDVAKRAIKFKLPGHRGGVGATAWHPTDPIVASGSVDQTVFLGELDL